MSTRIFIVEDERIVAEDIRMTLESFGYAVAGIAASRDQALAEIRRTLPDLVLMDIVLKGPGDGVETARLVREQARLLWPRLAGCCLSRLATFGDAASPATITTAPAAERIARLTLRRRACLVTRS